MQIARAMGLPYAPSAFQIRLGGSKGVVAIDKRIQDDENLYLRKSMTKYDSNYRMVEVLEFSRPSPLYLNQQVSTIFVLKCSKAPFITLVLRVCLYCTMQSIQYFILLLKSMASMECVLILASFGLVLLVRLLHPYFY